MSTLRSAALFVNSFVVIGAVQKESTKWPGKKCQTESGACQQKHRESEEAPWRKQTTIPKKLLNRAANFFLLVRPSFAQCCCHRDLTTCPFGMPLAPPFGKMKQGLSPERGRGGGVSSSVTRPVDAPEKAL